MRNLKPIFLFGSLLALLLLANCKPAATPAPQPPSPLPSPVAPQQIVPEATPEVLPGPVGTPIPPVVAASGIRITAKIGPTCPGPQRPGQVCEGPYEGEFSVTTSDGTEAARVMTDQNGQVTVDLPPGQYTVTPKIEGRLPSGAPVDVTVPPGEVVEVSVELDTGMR
jgi:hypothetical protein